jgi:hypothetical protein
VKVFQLKGEIMTTTKPLAIRNGRAITHYIYRDVQITRENDRMFTWAFRRFDLQDFERSASTLKGAVAVIELSLASTGRTTGGRLVVTSVENGQLVSALANPDWRYPHARLVSETEAGQ